MIQPKKAAGLLQSIGAKNSPDTVLAHITPEEAALLKARGGSGRRDKITGLLHFEDDSSSDSSSDSTSYGGTVTGGSWAGQSSYSDGINSVSSGGGHSDPSYSKKGYYSAAGDYDNSAWDGSGSTRYYTDRATLFGNLADSFGWDPEGFGANALMVGGKIAGAMNPLVGAGLKVGEHIAENGRTKHEVDSYSGTLEGNGLLSSLPFGSALKSVVSSFGNPSVSTAAANAAASGSLPDSMPGSSGTSANDLWLLKQRGLLSDGALQSNRTMT